MSAATTANPAPEPAPFVLIAEQIASFHENGFLVVPNLFPASALEALRNEINTLIDNHDMSAHRATFETGAAKQSNDDAYFLNSGRTISFFLETSATDDNGELVVPKREAFNKVGHGLHDRNPVFESFSYRPELNSIVHQLGQKHPKIVQSMYIFKSGRVGGEVTPHQDTSFVQTNPASCIGTWVSLEDATVENGCMYFVPGSHKVPVERFFNLNDDGMSCSFTIKPNGVAVDGQDADAAAAAVAAFRYDISKAIPVPVTAGSLVLIHGGVVHFSGHNNSNKNRNAYSLHVVDSGEGIEYPKTNWLRETADAPFRLFDDVTKKLYPSAAAE